MKADIIRIGNSQGVRIPKPVLEQCGFRESVEMEVRDGRLVISPSEAPRKGWNEAFREMAEAGDDTPLLEEVPASEWDDEEWEW